MGPLSLSEPWTLMIVALALALGGILKGATGAGLPIIAVPVLASVYDVRLAVTILVVPNLIINLWQVYKFRTCPVNWTFARNLAIAGGLGVAIGTAGLAWLPVHLTQLTMAAIIVAYIALRLSRPNVRMSLALADRWVWPAGGVGGMLQGAVGISAPVAVTFLNAMGLPRTTFILTVSAFFAAMCLVQLPVQIAYGLMTPTTAMLGLFAILPLSVALPIGEWIGRRVSAQVFDRLILLFLAALALNLIWGLS